jgi:AcrR family transcriptional regulator
MPSKPANPKAAVRATAGRPRKVSKDALVEAALRVMEREGYAALTARSLAKELGINHSTLYNYVEQIEDIEAQALHQLTAQLPLPAATAPRALRAELLAYLLAANRLLSQHPWVLFPPIDSPSWKTLQGIGEGWVRALVPHTPDEKTARLALAALVATAVVQAERTRVYGSGPVGDPKQRKTLAVAGIRTLEEALYSMMDLVLPGLNRDTTKAS